MEVEKIHQNIMHEAENVLFSSKLLYEFNSLSTEQLHFFFSQFYYFVHNFPAYLGLLLWKTDNEIIRFVITENLVDECGGIKKIEVNDFSGAHSRLLKNFVLSIQPKLAKKHVQTEILMNSFNQFFLNSSLLECLSAMTCMESISTKWFTLIHDQLKKRNEFSDEQLHFFKLHMSLDEVHGDILTEVLLPLLDSPENIELCQHATITTMQFWSYFYSGIRDVFKFSPYAVTV